MSLNFYRQFQRLLQQENAVVLITVIQSRGSVPREVGAKMMVCADGGIFETIGGGAGEARAMAQAKVVLATGEKQQLEIDLSGNLQRPAQGICGGVMQVWLERWSGQAAVDLIQQIIDRLQAGQPVTLVTPFSAAQSPYLLNDQPLSAPKNAFVETIQPLPTLLIVGAGHVGIQLARVADLIGFQLVVQDDRPAWANPQHYPASALVFAEPIAVTLDRLSAQTQLYAALVTRGYQYDLEALTALLNRSLTCAYIGMIGSQKRVRQVFQAIAQAGMTADRLQGIHAPIGLDIGALTPAEIAVSIAAELILVRRGGTGRSLSEQSWLGKV